MTNKQIISIIESTVDEDVLQNIKDTMTNPEADRGIYETWGGRAITTYNIVKELYTKATNETEQ